MIRNSDSSSLRQRVFNLLQKNDKLKPKHIAKLLRISYAKHGPTIANYKYNYKNDLRLNSLNNRLKRDYHNWHGWIRALESFDIETALRTKWKRTLSRNHYLLFKNKNGRLEWHPNTRHIKILVRKPFSRGKKLQLLSDAFFKTELMTDIELFMKWSDTARYKGHHTTVETGVTQPYFKEVFHDPFETLTVKAGDKSDRTKIEIERELTSLGSHLEEVMKSNIKALDVTAESLRGSSQLIKQYSEFMAAISQPRRKSDENPFST